MRRMVEWIELAVAYAIVGVVALIVVGCVIALRPVGLLLEWSSKISKDKVADDTA